MTFKQRKRCKVGLALYSFDWVRSTGTEVIAQELVRNITRLEQSSVEYKVLLRHDVSPEWTGLPPAVCLNAPPPVYRLNKRIEWGIKRAFYRGVDTVRGAFGFLPNLGYLGNFQIKDWLRSLDFDLFYYPSMWHHDLFLNVPIVAQLFDMQHIHFSEFWKMDKFQRNTVFNWYSNHASLITCNFDFVAKDIKENLKVPKERIGVIFLAPPAVPPIDHVYARSIKEKFGLPERYFIYPAATWPHKNHINLVRALAECVSSGLEIFCVCPGEHADWLYPGQFLKIQEEVRKCKVEKNIYFLGNIPHKESYALIQQADFVCVPTLYEAGCYSIWEACCFGKAVACSEVTMIPYQIRDAGLLFNPQDPSDIAQAIQLLHRDRQLRDDLGKKARELIDNPYYLPEKTPLGYH
jgi:glycosyltransferase involved in cell wall biosynthesis